MAAMGINEIQCATAYAKPQMNAYRSIGAPESPDDYISLLKRYLQLVPHLSPGPFRTLLSHLDLHLDPETKVYSICMNFRISTIAESRITANRLGEGTWDVMPLCTYHVCLVAFPGSLNVLLHPVSSAIGHGCLILR